MRDVPAVPARGRRERHLAAFLQVVARVVGSPRPGPATLERAQPRGFRVLPSRPRLMNSSRPRPAASWPRIPILVLPGLTSARSNSSASTQTFRVPPKPIGHPPRRRERQRLLAARQADWVGVTKTCQRRRVWSRRSRGELIPHAEKRAVPELAWPPPIRADRYREAIICTCLGSVGSRRFEDFSVVIGHVPGPGCARF